MNILFWSLLLLCTESAHAIRMPLRQHRRPLSPRSGNIPGSFHNSLKVLAAASDAGNLSLTDVHDLIYIGNVNIGGNEYPVQLDTGSSDLWIQGQTNPLPNSVQSSLTYNLTYGLGWAFGNISYAVANFAGITIQNQSYLDVSSANNPALSYGAQGIVGLGFTSLSTIDALVNQTGSSAGRSLLFNAFNSNQSEPNFLSFALSRTSDPNDEVVGAITIGEYIDEYKSVADTSRIPTWPPNSPRRWSVLLDAILVGKNTFPVSTIVNGAPSNKAVVLLDTGTSYTYVSQEVCQAIYGDVEGARYDAGIGMWFVPCTIEIDMALQINGVAYPIHPLDVSPYNYPDNQTCIGSLIPQTVPAGAGEFDWLIGSNLLRSVYSVFDFGDFDSSGKMGSPFVQLLSVVDPDEASAEFATVRGSTPRTNITYNVSPIADASSTVTSTQDISTTLQKLNNYIPIMLAVMGLNALVIILLLVLGIVYFCRRRRAAGTVRQTRGRSAPIPLTPVSTGFRESESEQSIVKPHSYEPVSMALTEDTFVPPSPLYYKGNATGGRPQSYFPLGKAVDETFVPPSPAFLKDPGSPRSDDALRAASGQPMADRPNSVA